MMSEIIGLGYCCMDYLAIVPRIPGPDEGVGLLEDSRQGGGPASTAMVTCARLGARASFIGCVGDDENGKMVISELEKDGVDTGHMLVIPGLKTAYSLILVEKGTGKRTIAAYRDPRTEGYLSRIDLSIFTSAKVLHLDGVGESSIRAAKHAKRVGLLVTCDYGGHSEGYGEALPHIDVLIPSRPAARELTGERDPVRAAKALLEKGPHIVGVTLGEGGSVCVTKDRVVRKPGFKVKVVDTTGAGDVYHGAFNYGLLREWPIDRIVEFSNAVAAIKCTGLGGRANIPTLAQAEDFMRSYFQRRRRVKKAMKGAGG